MQAETYFTFYVVGKSVSVVFCRRRLDRAARGRSDTRTISLEPDAGAVPCLSPEPNSFEKKAGIRVDGEQLGRDFTRLRELLSESRLYRDAGLYGPDVGQPRDHRIDILKG